MKNKIISVLAILLLVFSVGCGKKKENLTDAKRFAKEYTNVSEDNAFVYSTADEIIGVLESGTGIIYLGSKDDTWSQAYVKYLNEVVKEEGIEKVYYLDITAEQKNNTDKYLKIVDLLRDYLQYDDSGKKIIYIPTVIGMNKGLVVGFSDESAWNKKGSNNPEEYWNEEKITKLKNRLKEMVNATKTCINCDEDNLPKIELELEPHQ